ncbi:MAG: S-layer homology domain-containing protein [Methylocystaceae bacterium]
MKKSAVVGLILVFVISMLIGPAFAKSTKANSTVKETNKVTSTTVEKAKGSTVNNKNSALTSSVVKTKLKASAEQKETVNKALKEVSEISDYTDTKTHWGSQSIRKAKALGLLKGYEDGSFKPDATLSSLEATVIAVRVAENLSAGDTTTITTTDADTDEDATVPDWSKPSVDKAKALKIINTNRFHSQVQASRAEAAIMLAKALKLEPVNFTELPFPDVGSLTAEDIGYLLALQQAGVIHGSPDGKFNPNSSLTRAEIASMLANIADQVKTDPGTATTTGDTITVTAN